MIVTIRCIIFHFLILLSLNLPIKHHFQTVLSYFIMYIFLSYIISYHLSYIIYHVYILSYILTLKFEVCSYTMFQRVLYRALVPGLPRSVVCVCACAGERILKIHDSDTCSKPFILECVGTLLVFIFILFL